MTILVTGRCRSTPPGNAGATSVGYYVEDPERYGVAEVDAEGRALARLATRSS